MKVSIISILLFLLCTINSSNGVQNSPYLSDQSALLTLKGHISDDPHGIITRSWTTNTSMRNWHGVTCSPVTSGKQERVLGLNLGDMGLVGTIPPHIGNLSFLQLLNLGGNIPSALFNLSSVRKIKLGINNLVGNLPANICDRIPSVEHISLSYNQISGHIPSNLTSCQMLTGLYLEQNAFTGMIPDEIGDLSSLQYMYLGFNYLQGTIPASLSNLTSIVEIELEHNNISGSIPRDTSRWSSLEIFAAATNQLSGIIWNSYCNLTRLYFFALSGNNLHRSIPQCFGNLRNLRTLDLGTNMLTGTIPSSFSNLSKLEFLALEFNQLSGQIPHNIGTSYPNLHRLYLNDNNFNGTIPSSLSNATNLTTISLSSNHLTGIIPPTLGNLPYLQSLHLMNNNLTVEISDSEPNIFDTLSNCRMLEKLWLGSNPFNLREFPSSIGNLSTTVQQIDMSDCRIQGHIPTEIGKLPGLTYLNLSYNDFSGTTLPASLGNLTNLQELYLESCGLEGPIPDELCRATSIGNLHLHLNKLIGAIPSCFGNMMSLREVYLDNNKLSSSIPEALGNLKDLVKLNIAFNDLTGSLPIEIDAELVAHVSDFGLAKLLDEDQSGIVTKNMATIGYMAPEYGSGGLVSIKSDVYSFGVMLMETFTGMKPTDQMFEFDLSLKCWIIESMSGEMKNIVDPKLLHEDEYTDAKEICVRSVMELALNCTEELPKFRMSMTEIVAGLTKIMKVYSFWTRSKFRIEAFLTKYRYLVDVGICICCCKSAT